MEKDRRKRETGDKEREGQRVSISKEKVHVRERKKLNDTSQMRKKEKVRSGNCLEGNLISAR